MWDDAMASLLWVVFSVVLIIGLAYWFTRYVGRHGMPGGFQADKRMAVLAQLSLGRDQRLAAVQVAGRYFLLGITAGQITLLAELTEEEAAQWQVPRTPEGQTGFRDALREVLRQKGRR